MKGRPVSLSPNAPAQRCAMRKRRPGMSARTFSAISSVFSQEQLLSACASANGSSSPPATMRPSACGGDRGRVGASQMRSRRASRARLLVGAGGERPGRFDRMAPVRDGLQDLVASAEDGVARRDLDIVVVVRITPLCSAAIAFDGDRASRRDAPFLRQAKQSPPQAAPGWPARLPYCRIAPVRSMPKLPRSSIAAFRIDARHAGALRASTSPEARAIHRHRPRDRAARLAPAAADALAAPRCCEIARPPSASAARRAPPYRGPIVRESSKSGVSISNSSSAVLAAVLP